MDSNGQLFFWACSMCLIYSNVYGLFRDDDAAGDLLQELSSHLGGQQAGTGVNREGNSSPDPAAAAAASTAAPPLDLLGEMNESLEQAADLLGDLWRQFSKLLSRLEGGHDNTDARPTQAAQLQQPTPRAELQRTKTSTAVSSTATSSVETTTSAPP